MLVWLESTLPPLMSLLEDYSHKMKQQNETKRAISCLAPSVGNLLWSFQISNNVCDVPLSSLFPQRKSGHFDLLHRTILYCKLGPSIHLINLQNWNEMAWLAVGPQLWHLNIYLFDWYQPQKMWSQRGESSVLRRQRKEVEGKSQNHKSQKLRGKR